MHVSTRTPQEVRLLEGVARRVETYDAHQPFYDGSEGKKTESRGTEAVLNALILSSADAERGRREPSEPTRKALRRLWETQRPHGGGGGVALWPPTVWRGRPGGQCGPPP